METVLLGGLGYLGNKLNNERKDIKCKPNYKKVKQNRLLNSYLGTKKFQE